MRAVRAPRRFVSVRLIVWRFWLCLRMPPPILICFLIRIFVLTTGFTPRKGRQVHVYPHTAFVGIGLTAIHRHHGYPTVPWRFVTRAGETPSLRDWRKPAREFASLIAKKNFLG